MTFENICTRLAELSVIGAMKHDADDGGTIQITLHVYSMGKDHLVMQFERGAAAHMWFERSAVDVTSIFQTGDSHGERHFETYDEAWGFLKSYLIENEEGIRRALSKVFARLKE